MLKKLKDLVKFDTKNSKEKDWSGMEFRQKCKEWKNERGRTVTGMGGRKRLEESKTGSVRLQEWDQGAGKCGLRTALSQECELCNSYGGTMDWTR